MLNALYIGATGMQAQQLNVDTIANNLANVNTVGFKKAHVTFTDIMLREAAEAQLSGPAGLDGEAGALASLPLGAGVATASVTKRFEVGDMKQTGSPFDVAVQGDGFLEVVMPDGSRGFTRGGTLEVNPDGVLVTRTGHPLKPGIRVPGDATAVTIGADGQVLISVPGDAAPVDAGRLELVRFTNPGGLLAQGDNLYRASDASGEPTSTRPGEEGAGTLVQGYLEGSNVRMVDEMVSLMVAQRAYEASAKVVQASDEMLGMVNALRR
jgi:flagellar basal-body rod protein FlgG